MTSTDTTPDTRTDEAGRTVAVYLVTGMTCGHCAASVTEEVELIDGVREINVDVAGGRVTVTSDAPLDRAKVNDAVSEAGFTLVEG